MVRASSFIRSCSMKNVIYSLLALVIGVMVTVVPLQAQQQKDTARWPLQLFWLVDTEGVFQHKPPADALFQPLKSAAPKTLERTVWFRLEANNPSPRDSTFLFSCANQDFLCRCLSNRYRAGIHW